MVCDDKISVEANVRMSSMNLMMKKGSQAVACEKAISVSARRVKFDWTPSARYAITISMSSRCQLFRPVAHVPNLHSHNSDDSDDSDAATAAMRVEAGLKLRSKGMSVLALSRAYRAGVFCDWPILGASGATDLLTAIAEQSNIPHSECDDSEVKPDDAQSPLSIKTVTYQPQT